MPFMHDTILKRSQPGVCNLYGLRAASCWVSRCCFLPSCVFVDPDPHDTTLNIIPLMEALLTLPAQWAGSQIKTELLNIYFGNNWKHAYFFAYFFFAYFLAYIFAYCLSILAYFCLVFSSVSQIFIPFNPFVTSVMSWIDLKKKKKSRWWSVRSCCDKQGAVRA